MQRNVWMVNAVVSMLTSGWLVQSTIRPSTTGSLAYRAGNAISAILVLCEGGRRSGYLCVVDEDWSALGLSVKEVDEVEDASSLQVQPATSEQVCDFDSTY